MDNRTLKSKLDREYSIQYNNKLDIHIIMDCMAQEIDVAIKWNEEPPKYEFVNYVHGSPADIAEEDLLYYISKYEKANF